MRITPPSLYAAYEDKKRLFLEAMRRNLASGPSTAEEWIARAATAREAAAGLLHGSAVAFTGDDTPTGCLLATGAISCSRDAADVQAELASLRRGIEASLRARIEQAVDTGELPETIDADALAGHVMAVIQGISTLARDGAPREKLMRVADAAMLAWPAKRKRGARRAREHNRA